jgi:hypothetical protein
MDASTDPRHNQLLAALPQEPWQRWLPHLEHVNMPLAQVLYEPGGSGARSRRAGEAHVRVLRRGKEGVRQIAASPISGVALRRLRQERVRQVAPKPTGRDSAGC